MEYIIDGIRDLESNKVILYGAIDNKEFRKKRKSTVRSKRRCRIKLCTLPIPDNHLSMFHFVGRLALQGATTAAIQIITECSNKLTKTLNIQNKHEEENVPFKKIKINDKICVALIETGGTSLYTIGA